MRSVAYIACLLAFPAAGDNLVVNSDFEEIQGDMPAAWQLFVMPMPGAYGKASSETAMDGDYSAVLHNPKDYEKEPANNWSQNIEGVAGREVVLEGYVRTEDASLAFLIIQCFQKRPWTILRQESTSRAQPITGSQEWTRVSLDTDIPKGTDFVTVRCVLTGHGTAWFDSVTLRDKEDLADDGDSTDDESGATTRSNEAKPVDATQPGTRTIERPTATASKPATADGALLGSLLQTQDALREAQESNNALKEANEQLRVQLESIQNELRSIRDTLTPEPEPVKRTPPLVPRGWQPPVE